MVGEIERVLAALNDAEVRYLVVGGVAVVLHGHLRTTADLDLVVQLHEENVLRAIRALSGLGYRPRAPVAAEAFADAKARETWIREKGLTVFSMWSLRDPALEVDLFVEEPFDFDEVYSRAPLVSLQKTAVPVISVDDLIDLKRRTGRPTDLEDVDALRALAEPEPGGKDKHDA